MTGKGILKGVFNVATTGLAVIGAVSLAPITMSAEGAVRLIENIIYPSPPGIPLTEREASLAESIFGNEINTAHVKKYLASKARKNTSAQVFGKRKIKFYGARNHSTDYSQPEDTVNYARFAHELTHIWQRQRNVLRFTYYKLRHSNPDYTYKLSSQSRFGDFGAEQQASIIGDYVRQFFCSSVRNNHSANGTYTPSHDYHYQDLALLQKVVETRFPQARKTREALEAKAAAPAPLSPRLKGQMR